ncbi:MAG: DUF4331 family protein [Actinomycetota bacterium]
MDRKGKRGTGIALVVASLVLAVGAAPLIGFGADHLDAPNLTSPEMRPDADINDVYVFEGANSAHTAIAVTTHPAAGAISPVTYATDVRYVIRIDRNGDARRDIQYAFRFGKVNDEGRQPLRVRRRDTHGVRVVARGLTGQKIGVAGGGMAFAGLRSDPFFFDLDAFLGTVKGQGDRRFCDGSEVDFFENLNTMGIALEVPDGKLGSTIGVWAVTVGDDDQIDRMGRPAINTVFNDGNDKIAFNEGRPATDRARFGDNVIAVLKAFSALDAEGAYSTAEARMLMRVLLPDMVTYDTSTVAAGPLNGRALEDDVIDAELNIVTGGFPFDGRDATGAIPSDCVGPHPDYRDAFPYLGRPHSS